MDVVRLQVLKRHCSPCLPPPLVNMVQFDQYTWIFGFATVVGFICAFGIGANDVANSFATSVGSRALTMTQAIMVAAVCEFLGALLLGASVTDTVRSNIANVNLFSDSPELLMFGMLAVMITAAFWDNLACHLELPVSTTHTTVGAIVGMAWALRGSNAIVWSKKNINKATGDNDFPYLKGMSIIFLQWVVSPICSGVLVAIIFFLLRTFVLRSRHSFIRAFYVSRACHFSASVPFPTVVKCIVDEDIRVARNTPFIRAFFLFPFLVFVTFFVVVIFIIQTGNKNNSWDKVSDGKSVWISIVIGAGMGILTAAFIMPFLYKAVHADDARRERIEAGELDPKDAARQRAVAEEEAAVGRKDTMWHRSMERFGVNKFAQTNAGKFIFGNVVVKTLTFGATYEVHDAIDRDERIGTIWEGAEVFDFKTERLFRYLQIFSAMVMSFSHGSNDVANALGPYSAVYTIWNTSQVPSKSPVEKWILAYGGAGIVVGLATYGYKILQVLGVKAVKLTNARGFCCELSTAAVVIISSRFGLPVSTTQVITGALIAMGLFEGSKGVNWRVIFRTFFGWVLTLVVAALLAAAITSFVVYAPSKVSVDDDNYVANYLDNQALRMIRQMNNSAAGAAVQPTLNSLSKTVTALSKKANEHPYDYVAAHNATVNLYNSTLVT
ncbi:sodium phosphate symporter [Klebsormidium nitens]|uniref:Phosphate transporter n=1 Tax=Klebsormidium nitens TaxID=105231 RepID=A0A1Y1I3T7_KLENI|nr:sodium phosphate symporter [Klebsormidium nitens]|eukprot:GAQ82758.1 sodium phosphate symporter [Klebsormidium nitens]